MSDITKDSSPHFSPHAFGTPCIFEIRFLQLLRPPLASWLGLPTRAAPTHIGDCFLAPFLPRARKGCGEEWLDVRCFKAGRVWWRRGRGLG